MPAYIRKTDGVYISVPKNDSNMDDKTLRGSRTESPETQTTLDTRNRKSRNTDNIRYKTQIAPETQTTLDTRHRKPQRHRQH
jgi:hypothetical protein